MTTKSAEKTPRAKQVAEEPSPELLKTVHEIHTLTQMIYGELAATRPWLAPLLPLAAATSAVDPRMAWTSQTQRGW
jgi:hypothetical protein